MQLKCDLGAGLNCNYSLVNGCLVNFQVPLSGDRLWAQRRLDWTEFRKGNQQDKEFGGVLVIFFLGGWGDAAPIENAVWRVWLLDPWCGSRLISLSKPSSAFTDSLTESILQETICVCSGFCGALTGREKIFLISHYLMLEGLMGAFLMIN